MKTCCRCHISKEFSDFHKDKSQKDGLCCSCKECQLQAGKVSREKNANRETVTVPDYKTCLGCKIEKLSSKFSKNKTRNDGLNYHCKECASAASKAWVEKNKARENITVPEFKWCPGCSLDRSAFDFNKDGGNTDGLRGYCRKCDSIRRIKREYKITDGWYEATLEAQGWACAVCRLQFTEDKKPCVDHDHLTNENRGLLCLSCNFFIGLAKDSTKVLYNAIRYLNKFKEIK